MFLKRFFFHLSLTLVHFCKLILNLFFFPRFCFFCQNIIYKKEEVFVNGYFDGYKNNFVNKTLSIFCLTCFRKMEPAGVFDFYDRKSMSLFFYNSVTHRLLMEVKYGKNTRIQKYFCEILSYFVTILLSEEKKINPFSFERDKNFLGLGKIIEEEKSAEDYKPQDILIVTVPSHWKRIIKSRYYPLGILGKFLFIYLKKSVDTNGLNYKIHFNRRVLKKSNNKIQGKAKSREERFQQIKNAYKIRESICKKFSKDTRVILLDDMITSGATIGACLEALNVYFNNIFVLSLSCSYGFKKNIFMPIKFDKKKK